MIAWCDLTLAVVAVTAVNAFLIGCVFALWWADK